ncbi:hypothetical protein CDAR_286951 [Caerostris darwini]|uniref:Uncharacterized protein n=1 Tax=Caerostris darwini TaxID=1538125 RepID=A0AAV4R9M9_9ARAC|nr:hypothetical protein CDAR_286951 [Caerostris darwini]
MKGTSAYKSLFLTVLHEITIIASLPHKNDSHLTRPKHAVSILSNKKNTRFCASKHPPPISENTQKISHLSRYRRQMVLTIKSLNISVAKPTTPSKDTLQRVVCDCRTRGEARAFGNILLKLLANDFHYGG